MTTTTTYYAPTPPSRPLGVAILAVLIGIYGFIEFLIGLFVVIGSAVFSSISGSFSQFGLSGALLGAVLAVIGLIILGLAVGLWHLRMWALVLMLIFLGIELVLNGLAGTFISFGFIVAALLFVYLLAVSRHFR